MDGGAIVNRFDCAYDSSDECAYMALSNDGAYVAYEDYERLKKELENLKEWQLADYWISKGERRAMERVKEILNIRFELWKPSGASENRSECVFRRLEISDIYNALGLGDDKPFNPATDHHNCSAGTCAACGHFGDLYSFPDGYDEKENTDNNNYTNKEVL